MGKRRLRTLFICNDEIIIFYANKYSRPKYRFFFYKVYWREDEVQSNVVCLLENWWNIFAHFYFCLFFCGIVHSVILLFHIQFVSNVSVRFWLLFSIFFIFFIPLNPQIKKVLAYNILFHRLIEINETWAMLSLLFYIAHCQNR